MGFRTQLKTRNAQILAYLALHFSYVCGVASDPIQILLPKHRIHARELAVIVNDADPLSIQIADYYQKVRNIPSDNVVHVRFDPGRPRLSETEFRRIKSTIEANTPPAVQAYAVTWAAPYRVACMSITSAFTFGFDRSFCSEQHCAATRRSPYFDHPVPTPYSSLGIRPTMSIAATSFEEAKALIDRGIRADKSQPADTAYLVSTADRRRNVRSVNYAKIEQVMGDWIPTRVVETDALKNAGDILFYFTGRTRVPHLDTLDFTPGAIADHLTSTGGVLVGNNKQMSALRWLEAGATGSYGTVVEPCNHPGKFPRPALVMDSYGAGRTLLEAYWQSVEQPGEGIFIGEPLAAPFDGYLIEVEADRIVLETRTLLPGLYQLSSAHGPVGPYRPVPGLIKAAYHQRKFILPKLEGSYYRLQRVDLLRQ